MGRTNWIEAARAAIAEGGLAAAAVEPLAARVGATKGSFYWHFADRAALIEATLITWEREETDDVIAELETVADPTQRLRRLMAVAMQDERDQDCGPVDLALLAAAGDPLVGPVLARVQAKRLRFLERCFRDLGHPVAESRHRARLAYSVYLGWFEQLRGRGDGPLTARERSAYQRTAVALLTAQVR